jgi:nondiscriminating glutamyl-tRNA synthetase
VSAPRVRFAPSPTGSLHIGGARTALFNWLFARSRGGAFVLRIEDTDAERSTEQSAAEIVRDLTVLGLAWDEGPGIGGEYGPYFQSQRIERHRRVAQELLERGLAYRSFQSAEELERIRAERGRGENVDPTARYRQLSADEERERLARGEAHAIVFQLPAGETTFGDLVRGDVSFRNDEIGDFVLIKSDGRAAYNFAAAVDDLDMGITHVIRGEDHLSNTPKQIHLCRALGRSLPAYGHLPLILGPDRTRLSKRHGATSVQGFLELGLLPEALVNYLALLGWSAPDGREILSRAELAELFALERVAKTAATFDLEKLEWVNGQHWLRLPLERRGELIQEFLEQRGVREGGQPVSRERAAELAGLVGDRMRLTPQFLDHAGFFFTEPEAPAPEDVATALAKRGREVDLELLANRLEAVAPLAPTPVEAMFRQYVEESGIKLRQVMAPVRLALTGKLHSPDLFAAICLLGRERVVARLRGFSRSYMSG